jgi:hypothetical protein
MPTSACRLARFGWRAAVLASTTGEEAACRWGVWLRQRARWLKGWMQVGLVHLRSPPRTWRELGPAGSFVALVLMVGMTLSALTHPLFLGLFVWSVAAGGLFAPEPDWLAATVGGLSLWPSWPPATASTCWPAGWRRAALPRIRRAAASPGAAGDSRLLDPDLARRLPGAVAAAAPAVPLEQDRTRPEPLARTRRLHLTRPGLAVGGP